MLEYRIEKNDNLKDKPKDTELGFGKFFTDNMFLMNYTEGLGWHDARIVPYGEISLSPAAMVFHYAQEMFEGLKAYRTHDGSVQLFRPIENIKRMQSTCKRLCIPPMDTEMALDAVKAIVSHEKDWVPQLDGTSLYIRPFIIATEASLGVHVSKEYLFCIILSPVGAYYSGGLTPVKIYIEKEYVRAVKGGTGAVKVGGNYASSLIGQNKAKSLGYSQVLWLDGVERKYIDEVGAMNVFFVIADEIITPSLEDGNILPGITRASCITLLKSLGYKVSERKISLDELLLAHNNNTLKEAFGTGTAAVISPIGEFCNGEEKVIVGDGSIGEVAKLLYENLTGIQWGKITDNFDWTVKI